MRKEEFLPDVLAAIQALPERQRTIVTKRLLDQQRFEAIAESMGEAVDTVKTIYYRGTEAIRKKCGASFMPSEPAINALLEELRGRGPIKPRHTQRQQTGK